MLSAAIALHGKSIRVFVLVAEHLKMTIRSSVGREDAAILAYEAADRAVISAPVARHVDLRDSGRL